MVNKTFKTPHDNQENSDQEDQNENLLIEPAKKEPNLTQKKKSLFYYSQLFNSIVLGFFLTTLSIVVVQSFFLLEGLRDFLKSNQAKLSSTLTNIESSSKALEQSAKAVQAVSESQNKLLLDPKTQEGIAILLRQADDLARTVKKVNITLDKVNNDILPNTNNTIKTTEKTIAQAGATLAQTEKSIAILTSKGEIVIDSTNSSIRALEAILAQPNLKVIVDNMEASSRASISTVQQLNISAEEINKALPELLAKINQIGDNTDLSGKEITKFLAGLNKPISKKEKAFRFILESIIKSSPALLRR